ncbi:putative bifunctional diguanylate cyclase/phosphodiesterase [Bowmanella denitrificans]|uniref:putative bifunctional diguanylate cyclase/phosphodiesterase n=1 Tax=Bowmanella denitrificans TaxID=366582 RepID=UPI001558A3CB|nr:EAL domain-containing protein [Bowmanella denitrificans]
MHLNLLSAPAFFTASIAMNLMVAIMVLASGLYQRQNQAYLSFFFLCLVVSLYQWSTIHYHEAQPVESAVYWLKLQTACYIAVMPTAFYCFAVWTKQHGINVWLKLLLIWSLILAILNFMQPYGLKFSQINAVITWQSAAGQQLQNFVGPLHWSGILLHLTGLVMIIWLLWRCWELKKQGKSVMAISILIFVLLLFASWMVAAAIQTGRINSVQLVGFTFNYFMLLVCINVASQLHRQRNQLQQALTTSKRVAGALRGLVKSMEAQQGCSFYDSQVMQLQKLYQADLCFVGLYKTDSTDDAVVQALSMYKDGEKSEGYIYPLKNTPCQSIKDKRICAHYRDVQKQFPHDAMLVEQNFQSYIGAPILDTDGQPLGLIALLFRRELEAIPEYEQTLMIFAQRTAAELRRERAELSLKQAAFTDGLTGLANRKTLWEWLTCQPKEVWRGYPTLQVLIVDIDGFREINKLHGQAVGDKVLQAISKQLKAYVKQGDLLARYTSNSFVVIKEGIESPDDPMLKLHGEMLASLVRTPIRLANRQLKLSASIGSVLACQARNIEELLRYAESAKQQAKQQGPGSIRRFDPALQTLLDSRQSLEKELADSIKEGQFFLLFQPQTSADGQLLGAETLIRWAHPVKGMIRPDLFISVAEETGLIRQLGQWLFEAVFRQIQIWRRQKVNYPHHLAINVSPLQFVDPSFVENLKKQVLYYDIEPSEIVLELVETGLLDNKHETLDKLHKLRAMGFKLALDDFGTGYSSLSYLKDLPLDILKIDKSFVDDLQTPSTLKLVHAIVDISHNLNLDVVCEGVEHQWQVNTLKEMGCRRFQGYYFARPLQADTLVDWQFTPAEQTQNQRA